MKAFVKFNRGLLMMPLYWRVWVATLVGVNVVAPLFFLPRMEALMALAAMMASMTLMVALTSRFGFTRVLGLAHVFWAPLLVFFILRLGDAPATDVFGVWMRMLILLNGVSLVIDAADVVRYIAGERQETVAGL